MKLSTRDFAKVLSGRVLRALSGPTENDASLQSGSAAARTVRPTDLTSCSATMVRHSRVCLRCSLVGYSNVVDDVRVLVCRSGEQARTGWREPRQLASHWGLTQGDRSGCLRANRRGQLANLLGAQRPVLAREKHTFLLPAGCFPNLASLPQRLPGASASQKASGRRGQCLRSMA